MEERDNSIITIATLHYKNYEVLEEVSSLMCYGDEFEEKTFEVTKISLFKDTLLLGEHLFNTIENLIISNEITSFIDDDNLDNDKLGAIFHDFFPIEFFEDIRNKVINNKNAINYLLTWINKYGLPNVDNSVYYDIHLFKSNNVNIITNELDYINSIFNCYGCDILPLINSSIMFYLIFNLQTCISQVKIKFLRKYLQPFPYLEKLYKEFYYDEFSKEYSYDSDFGRDINQYLKKLIQILNYYLPDAISSRDEFINGYQDLDLPDIKEDVINNRDNKKAPNLFNTEYLSRSPVLTAYDYLLQVLPLKNFNSAIYYCDNCNETLISDDTLCIGCKLELGKYFLNFHSKKISKISNDLLCTIKNSSYEELNKRDKSIKNSLDYINSLENELSLLKEKGVVETPIIVKLYRDKRDQKNTRNREKSN